MQKLGMEEGVPIEHRFVTRAIRNAQEKVEGHNFDIRKHLLEYDDVLNKQREVIYARRRDLLSREDLGDEVREMAEGLAVDLVASHCSDEVAHDEWDLKTLDDAVFAQFNLRLGLVDTAASATRAAQVEELVSERVRQAYAEREALFTPPVMRHLERVIWLQTLDTLWRDHLLSMDHLKEGIGLRGYGQKNPLQEYQKEGYDLFEELMKRMEMDVVEKLMSVQLQVQPASAQASAQMRAAAAPATAHESGDFEPPMPAAVVDLQRRQQQQTARMRLSHGGDPAGPQKVETVRRDVEKVGRNDPCPCGSGKKFKKCHGAQA
jgi:preprotein translocase subunit SecA